ncbi:hypothetical protein FSARC_12462 [Fusarium sarcochroum]|uniref:Heterokaryon incompatibility domain-containing protein n=1 Tax=Fusarium sarcochroum TaxID=1208366 RepID=A0A8H4T8D3_9HYPO|nr:hypothetical protein FSARC_12462 [Fusarium sarcochroum]
MRRLLQPLFRPQLNPWLYRSWRPISQASTSRLYKPLNPKRSEIRLLKLPQDTSAEFELVTVSLDDEPKYAALSYLWGDPKNYGQVTIKGHTVKVPDNLASAFLCALDVEYFRKQTHVKYLWADAICINQNDLEERSEQVQLMRRIFGSALFTFAWVGPKDYSLAFKTIQTLASIIDQNKTDSSMLLKSGFDLDWLRHHPHLCLETGPELTNNHLSDPWSSVSDFLQHEYWKRVWIFQEIVLTNELIFMGPGEVALTWPMLRDTAQNLCLLALKLQKEKTKPGFISDSAWSLLNGIKGWVVSSFACNLQATDDRDYIYGLLGVSGIPMTPDYSPENKASHVYTKYIAGWLKAARDQQTMHVHTPLAFLSIAGIGKFGHSDLPSWVPNYPKNETVAHPWCYGTSNFRSSVESSPADIDTYPYVVEATRSLFTWGVDMGAITLTTNPSGSDSEVLSSFMSLATSFTALYPQYISGIPSSQAIIKLISMNRQGTVSRELIDSAMNLTLCINCFNTFEHQPVKKTWGRDWDYRLFDMAFPKADLKQFGFGPDLISEINSWDRTRRTEALQGIMLPLYNRKFFETRDGYLGSANLEVMEGDRLCIISGYIEPVIVRPAAEGSFIFVGTAFAVDVDMEDTLRKMQPQGHWFELR